jgi:hypothetical protein
VQASSEILLGHFGGFGPDIAANDRRGVRHHRLQAFGCTIGTSFLHEADQRAEYHHRPDHDRGLQVLGQEGDASEYGEQQVEGILVAVPQVHPPGQRIFMLVLVGRETGQSFDRLRSAQPVCVR